MEWFLSLGVAFAAVGLAELADKTQLVTISQACRYPYPPVLAGSALALVVVTAIGVIVGTFLNWLLPVDLLNQIAGGLFLVLGLMMVRSWVLERRDADDLACPEEGPVCDEPRGRIFAHTFGLVALAELADKTQLTVVAIAGSSGHPLAVFAGASLALVLVSTASVMAGRMVARRFSLQAVQLFAALLFVVLGLVLLLRDPAGM